MNRETSRIVETGGLIIQDISRTTVVSHWSSKYVIIVHTTQSSLMLRVLLSGWVRIFALLLVAPIQCLGNGSTHDLGTVVDLWVKYLVV